MAIHNTHTVTELQLLQKGVVKSWVGPLRGSPSGFTGFTGSLTAVDCVTYINYVPTPMGQGGIEVAEKNCQISTGYSSTILRSKSSKSMFYRFHNTDGAKLSCIEQRRFLSISC